MIDVMYPLDVYTSISVEAQSLFRTLACRVDSCILTNKSKYLSVQWMHHVWGVYEKKKDKTPLA
jgi:hypothetical protein